MAYRKIDTRIWNDAKFLSLSDKGKLAFLFMLTHPHLTSMGAMRATIPGLASELQWSLEAFREAFREAFSKGMVRSDESVCFVSLPNFLKYNKPESPNVIRSWGGLWDLIPECSLKVELYQHLREYSEGLGEAFAEAFREAFRKAMPNLELKLELKLDKDPPNPPSGGKAVLEDAEKHPEPKGAELSPGFEQFWKEWPKHHRKQGKSACARKWKRARLESITEQVIAALKRAKAGEFTKNGGEFIPLPMTWLNRTPWETDASEMEDYSSLGLCDPNNFPGRIPTPEEEIYLFGKVGPA